MTHSLNSSSRRVSAEELCWGTDVFYKQNMTHAQLVTCAVRWLRKYGCGIVLSEQVCASGEIPDAIGWKGRCHSVVVECKVSRDDFFADREKPFRKDPGRALGCERLYLVPRDLIADSELPEDWGLLEFHARKITTRVRPPRRNLRSATGLGYEMNLLLASLRRVEVRIAPQSITEFLRWKNRMLEYNGGVHPAGIVPIEAEDNAYLESVSAAP